MRMEIVWRPFCEATAGEVKSGARIGGAGAGIDNSQLGSPLSLKQHIDPIGAYLNNLKIGLRMLGKI